MVRRFPLVLLMLFAVALAGSETRATDPAAVARRTVEQWLDGKLSPGYDLNELRGMTPEEAANWLRNYLAFPPPPPGLEVNLEDPEVKELPDGYRVGFPATLGQEGGEVIVRLSKGEPVGISWKPNGGMLPPWVRSNTAALLFAAASILLALQLLQGGVSRLWRAAWVLLAPYKKLYLFVNLLLYGLFVLGAAAAYAAPELARAVQEGVGMALETIGLGNAAQMGMSRLAWVIFYWNFSHGLLLTSFLPAVFFGVPALLINMGRYLAFGFALSPATFSWSAYVYHLPTLLIELQAYILVTFGGLVLLWETLKGRGYRYGLNLLGLTLLLGTLFLIAGAWYEAYELLYLLR